MNILGINYFFHDSTACIVTDGVLISAIEEERLSRIKHTGKFPELAIKKCLDLAGIRKNEIDYVAVSIKPSHKWFAKLFYPLKSPLHAKQFYNHEFRRAYHKQKKFWAWYNGLWGSGKKPKVYFIEHHLAHVEGSFYVSPYEKAALLSLDGSGEWATSFLGLGKGNQVQCFNQSFFPMSSGIPGRRSLAV